SAGPKETAWILASKSADPSERERESERPGNKVVRGICGRHDDPGPGCLALDAAGIARRGCCNPRGRSRKQRPQLQNLCQVPVGQPLSTNGQKRNGQIVFSRPSHRASRKDLSFSSRPPTSDRCLFPQSLQSEQEFHVSPFWDAVTVQCDPTGRLSKN